MLILNVDDDIDDREMFQAAVKAIDPTFTCLQFESGIKLLKYITDAEIAPDVIFIDINMPKMNGYECVEHLRQMRGIDNMQIVLYSTAFNPKQQENFRDLSTRYVNKTSRFSELVQSINKILLESKESVEKSKK